MVVLRLALKSLRARWLAAVLTVVAIAVSTGLFLGVEKVRSGARASFADTISGTDLILGPRAGDIQLLLYAVFRIGNPTNNITMRSLTDIAGRPEVAWLVPLSLGDSHRGFRVLGTTPAYFEHYRFRRDRPLTFAAGGPFADLFDAVLGADVAARLGYGLGDPLVIQHGLGEISARDHADKPFRVAGILGKTGTPVDRTVHVSLRAIEAIHVDWRRGSPDPARRLSAEQVRNLPLEPRAATAALVGVKRKIDTFKLQRFVNQYREEPLTATLPGVALQELWSLVGAAETALSLVSAMVVLTALLGMTTMILTTLDERRRELAILRSVGARPATILGLLVAEAGFLTAAGVTTGCAALYSVFGLLRSWVDQRFGLYLALEAPTVAEWAILIGIVAAGCALGAVPAVRAYRMSLVDGMTVRI